MINNYSATSNIITSPQRSSVRLQNNNRGSGLQNNLSSGVQKNNR